MNRNVHKTVEIPQLQHTDQVVDVPVVVVAQVPQGHVDEDSRDPTVAVGRASPTGADRGGDYWDPTVAVRGENCDDPRDPDGTGPLRPLRVSARRTLKLTPSLTI